MSRHLGTIYLLHFSRPLAHAKHYTGFATEGHLEERLQQHRTGRGARIMAVCAERGIGFTLARTSEGDRNQERRLKCRGATRRCPLCKQARSEP